MSSITDRHRGRRLGDRELADEQLLEALAAHDITAAYQRLIAEHGWTPSQLAATGGHSQTEVSDLRYGRRIVAQYEVLSRIADQFGVPRGVMGLAFSPTDVAEPADDVIEPEVSDVERRRFVLSTLAAVLAGATNGDLSRLTVPTATPLAAPATVTEHDLGTVTHLTRMLSHAHQQVGGAGLLDAAAGHLRWARALLTAPGPEALRPRLETALGELHDVCGWIALTAGQLGLSLRHVHDAATFAHRAGDYELLASAMWTASRAAEARGDLATALRYVQTGAVCGERAASPHATALHETGQASLLARLGHPDHARHHSTQARNLVTDTAATTPTATSLTWVTADKIRHLAADADCWLPDHEHAEAAAAEALRIRKRYPADRATSRAGTLITAAAGYLRSGSSDRGLNLGEKALAEVEAMDTAHLRTRLAMLAAATSTYPATGTMAEFRQLVAAAATPQIPEQRR